jgi:hypothetical protein
MSLVSSDDKGTHLARTITLGIAVGGMVERASERALAKHDTRRLDRAAVESIMASTILAQLLFRQGTAAMSPTQQRTTQRPRLLTSPTRQGTAAMSPTQQRTTQRPRLLTSPTRSYSSDALTQTGKFFPSKPLWTLYFLFDHDGKSRAGSQNSKFKG